MEKQIARIAKFYIGKAVKHNNEIGTVKSAKMMSEMMVEVEFGTHTAILTLKEIELATPSEIK